MLRRLLVQIVGIGLVTLAVAEVSVRVVLGIRPLSTDSTVWEAHPTRGWAHRPGASEVFVRLGFRQPIRINSHGLREREIPYARTPGRKRILVIGDSGVASFEVAPEDMFTRVMEREFAARGLDIEVINAGCRGYGTDQSLLFLREEGLAYRPDLVLYRYSGNDADDNLTIHKPFRRFGKAWFGLGPGGALELRGTPVPIFDYAAGARVGENGEVVRFTADAGERVRTFLRDTFAGSSAFAAALLHLLTAAPEVLAAVRDADDEGVRARTQLDHEALRFRLTRALVAEMEREAREAGASFVLVGPRPRWRRALNEDLGLVDLAAWELYRSRVPEGAATTVPFDPHQNELGHRLFGVALVDRLLERGLIEREPASEPASAPDG